MSLSEMQFDALTKEEQISAKLYFNKGMNLVEVNAHTIVAIYAKISTLRAKITELQKDSDFLERLRNAGVDNWPGYEEGFPEEDDDHS